MELATKRYEAAKLHRETVDYVAQHGFDRATAWNRVGELVRIYGQAKGCEKARAECDSQSWPTWLAAVRKA